MEQIETSDEKLMKTPTGRPTIEFRKGKLIVVTSCGSIKFTGWLTVNNKTCVSSVTQNEQAGNGPSRRHI